MSDSIEVRHFNGRMETPTGRDARIAASDDWRGSGYFEIIRLLMLAGFVLLFCSTARGQFTVEVLPQVQRFDVVIQQSVMMVDADHYVVMFTRASCGPCHAYINGGKLDELKLRFPVTVIHAEQNTQWKHLSVPTFWLARRSDRKVLTRYTGSTDVSIFVADVNRLTKPQIKQTVQSTQDMIRLHDQLHNQASGLNTHWTYPGDIRTHLQSVHHVSL